jgi:predicted lysophospholipase L1 biosynthesis ABC-type transport system permease subunit
MDEHDVEDLLRRVRPVGPPAELRLRIEQEAALPVPAPRAWPWAAAAAALLVLTAGLRVEVNRLESRVEVPPDPAIAIVDDLAERLGGDAAARRMATLMVLEQQMRAERAVADLEGQGRP